MKNSNINNENIFINPEFKEDEKEPKKEENAENKGENRENVVSNEIEENKVNDDLKSGINTEINNEIGKENNDNNDINQDNNRPNDNKSKDDNNDNKFNDFEVGDNPQNENKEEVKNENNDNENNEFNDFEVEEDKKSQNENKEEIIKENNDNKNKEEEKKENNDNENNNIIINNDLNKEENKEQNDEKDKVNEDINKEEEKKVEENATNNDVDLISDKQEESNIKNDHPEEQKPEEEKKPEEQPKNEEINKDQDKEEKIETPEQKSNYKVDYYRDNIFNLLNQLNSYIPISEIPEFLVRAFAMDDSIYSEKFYFKGIFPKIIVSKNIKDDNRITGMCSFYYESNENLNENLTLRINSILVGKEDYEEQIIEMMKFIKEKVECDKIMIYILYDRIEDKFVANVDAKNLFQNKLKFKWFCVVRNEKLNQRYIQYSFNKKEEIYDPTDTHETTKMNNILKHNKNNFLMNNLLIASINNKEEMNILKEQITNKISYNKYINLNALYFLIIQNQNIKSIFDDDNFGKELKLMSEKITNYTSFENNYENNEKSSIKNVDEELNNSIFKQIQNFYQLYNIGCLPNLFRTNLCINFETNYSMIMNDIYYNRISTDKIQVLEEEKTGSKFFLIPSKDNNILFYISEINNKLKSYLIDNNTNIYEKFLEFQPSTQKKIFEYSLKSIRDVSYIPHTPRNDVKTICIPCFSFKTHLFSYNSGNMLKNMKMMKSEEKEIGNNLSINTVDEFINVEFKPDNDIDNSFSTIEAYDLIIQNSFIMGIFDNDVINNKKLPLLQFLYITKDHFMKK